VRTALDLYDLNSTASRRWRKRVEEWKRTSTSLHLIQLAEGNV
jgi:phage repressor protein C with HTH and peptisase S24 domain